MDIAFKYQYITIIVLAHHLGRLLQCREVRKKSAKAARPSPASLVQGCLHHRILRLPFLLHGDDSAIAGYLLAPPGGQLRELLPSAGSLPLVIIRPFSGPSRESSVRGVGPGLVPGDVVGVDGVVPPDLGAAHLRGVVVAALVQDLHQRECRLVVDGLVQAGRCLQM